MSETEDYRVVIRAQTAVSKMDVEGISGKSSANNNMLKLFPNPASSTVHVEHNFSTGKPIRVKVWNATGEVMLSQLLRKTTIDVRSLTNGIYIVQLIQGNKMRITKLIIQH